MDKIYIKADTSRCDKTIRDVLLSLHLGKEKIYFYEQNKSFFVGDVNVNQWYKLKKDETLIIELKENIDVAPIPSTLKVVYEDDYFLVVNKPRGMLVHSDGNKDNITLENLIANYYKTYRIKRNIRICNRLDIETEGLVLVAKDDISEAYLNHLIANRKIEKRYYAVCHNRFSKKEGIIDLPIGRNLHKNNQMIVYKKGKEALTEYKVLKNDKISLLDINLITGRTHQIRVHLSYLNHPLVGDNIYGENKDGFPLGLQSYYVSFYHPFFDKQIEVKLDMSDIIKEMIYGK